MKRIMMTTFLIASLIASANADSGQSTRSPLDSNRRQRLSILLAAFHELPRDRQEQVRALDRQLHDDPSVLETLRPVMQRYTAWLASLSPTDRDSIRNADGSSERLRIIDELRKKQWLASLTPEQRKNPESAKADEAKYRLDRQAALRILEESQPQGSDRIRAEVSKFVAEKLNPLLTEPERKQLGNLSARNNWMPYVALVADLSQAHGLTPPGSPEMWKKARENRGKNALPK